MSKEIVKFGKSPVFFDSFTRRPGPVKTNMHYCPGCGHGILHKLLAEAIADRGIQEKVMLVAPVGCAVMAYYYFNCGCISVPHGRAPAVGTGIARVAPDKMVISYQGDGDLAAIGFNEFIQAANRGEKMSVFFVNNSNYGMTGGQMAPTTLPGQKTTTTPYGRNVEVDGYPMKVCELLNSLDVPVYIERCALTSTANIQKARKSIGKALDNLRDRKGFSFVELLCACPINLRKSAADMNKFIDEEMTKYYPLGCFRDRSAESESKPLPPPPIHDPETVRSLLYPKKLDIGVAHTFRNESKLFDRELRLKMAGFGGQGILSLGIMLANMAKLRNFNVSWLPSYGPEQRGGSANCSVIVSRNKIGSPIIDSSCDLLIAISQTALDKFKDEVVPGSVLIYDSSTMTLPPLPEGVIICGVNASEIALKLGNAKCANSVLLGALAAVLKKNNILEGGDKADFDKVFNEAVFESFSSKPEVIELNRLAFVEGEKAVNA
ncbi:MAG: 2-oxoacid:acceptor oxidoreductase family protein [Victivallaceae bacterium]|nr:2-oxoacid:acceptor oxidoreductase family protein [Victivallaceae bacterium]